MACGHPDGGAVGLAQVTFLPNGTVYRVALEPGLAGTSIGECVVAKYSAIQLPSFSGAPITISHAYSLK